MTILESVHSRCIRVHITKEYSPADISKAQQMSDHEPPSPEQPTCIVHEMRNADDWKNIKRTVVRVPQILKQKASIGAQLPPDEEHDEVYADFCSLIERLELLEAEVLRYTSHTKSHLAHSINLGRAFSEVFDPGLSYDGSATLNSQKLCSDEEAEKFTNSRKFVERSTNIMHKTSSDLAFITDNVVIPLTRIIALTKSVKRVLKEREYALLDANKYLNAFRNLDSKDKKLLTLNQQHSLIRYERNHEVSKLKFEQINEQLKNGLPGFLNLAYKFIRPLHISLYYLQLSIHYRMFQELSQLQGEEFQLKIGKSSPVEFSDYLSTTFYQEQKSAKDLVESLSLLRSPLTYRSNSSEKSTSQQQRSDSGGTCLTVKTTPNFLYCFANYSYEAQQEGDLSFNKGDKLRILDQSLRDWWKCELENIGAVGLIPSNYVTKIDKSE